MTLQVGIDLVHIERIAESHARFGERFLRRIYTPGEIGYALAAPARTAERLAARFAAKEAAIKALGLAERGVAWTDIEVAREPSGACRLVLHGPAAAIAGGRRYALSLSHDGAYATAIVVGPDPAPPFSSTTSEPLA